MKSLKILAIGVSVIPILIGCGKSGSSSDPAYPACTADYVDQYNKVASDVRIVKADVDRAYGDSKPSDPDDLLQARRLAYRDSRACRAEAVDFESRFNGVKCIATINNETKTIDTNSLMDQVINGMDMIPDPGKRQLETITIPLFDRF